MDYLFSLGYSESYSNKYRRLAIHLPQLLGAQPLGHRSPVPLLASFAFHLHDTGSLLPSPLPTSLCTYIVSPVCCPQPQFIAPVTSALTWTSYLNVADTEGINSTFLPSPSSLFQLNGLPDLQPVYVSKQPCSQSACGSFESLQNLLAQFLYLCLTSVLPWTSCCFPTLFPAPEHLSFSPLTTLAPFASPALLSLLAGCKSK